MRLLASSFSPFHILCRSFLLCILPLMPPQPWATPEQLAFLLHEDSKWPITKAGSGTLKSFYSRTTISFLKWWPQAPTANMLENAKNDTAKAQELVFARMLSVSWTSIFSSCVLTWRSSASPTGIAIITTPQSKPHQSPNHSLTFPGRPCIKNPHCRNGRPSPPCITA